MKKLEETILEINSLKNKHKVHFSMDMYYDDLRNDFVVKLSNFLPYDMPIKILNEYPIEVNLNTSTMDSFVAHFRCKKIHESYSKAHKFLKKWISQIYD